MNRKKYSQEKISNLKSQGNLHPHAYKVKNNLFLENEFFEPYDIVQVKYEMLRSVRTERIAIKYAAKIFGFSRTAFYQAQSSYEQEGVAGLIPQKRGPRNRHKLKPEIVQFILSRRKKDPSISHKNLAIQVKDHFRVIVHPRSIIRVLKSQNKKLNETKKKP